MNGDFPNKYTVADPKPTGKPLPVPTVVRNPPSKDKTHERSVTNGEVVRTQPGLDNPSAQQDQKIVLSYIERSVQYSILVFPTMRCRRRSRSWAIVSYHCIIDSHVLMSVVARLLDRQRMAILQREHAASLIRRMWISTFARWSLAPVTSTWAPGKHPSDFLSINGICYFG
jgi:hypothetical protein